VKLGRQLLDLDDRTIDELLADGVLEDVTAPVAAPPPDSAGPSDHAPPLTW
jgi:hypothetical protein